MRLGKVASISLSGEVCMAVLEDTRTQYGYIYGFTNANSDGYLDQGTHRITFSRNVYRAGTRLPNYRLIISSRGDATTDYVRWMQYCAAHSVSAHVSYIYNDHGRPVTGTLDVHGDAIALEGVGDFFGPGGESIDTERYNLLLVNFLNKVADVRTQFDGATNLGEFRETLHGLKNPASALRRGLSEYLQAVKERSARLRTLRRIVDVARQTWLEYSFGWRPLFGAIEDAGNALNAQLDTFNDTKRVASSLRWETSRLYQRDTVQDVRSWFRWNRTVPFQGYHKVRMFGVISRSLNRENRFSSGLGLTPHNWLPAAWELLPFSFVTDYFINIGDCLRAAGTCTDDIITVGLSHIEGGTFTYNCVADPAYTYSLFASDPNWTVSVSMTDTVGFITHYRFTRTRLDKNNLGWIVPTFNVPSLPTQFINLAALSSELRSISQSVFRR